MQKCRIKGTVVGMRTRIGDDAVIEDSVIMGSDTYLLHVINQTTYSFLDSLDFFNILVKT